MKVYLVAEPGPGSQINGVYYLKSGKCMALTCSPSKAEAIKMLAGLVDEDPKRADTLEIIECTLTRH